MNYILLCCLKQTTSLPSVIQDWFTAALPNVFQSMPHNTCMVDLDVLFHTPTAEATPVAGAQLSVLQTKTIIGYEFRKFTEGVKQYYSIYLNRTSTEFVNVL